MAEQRPFGRFRLPWLSAVTAPQPQFQTQTTRPIEIVAPAQPQRPPFRPAGIAQVQPALARTEPQPPLSSPSRAATESQISAQPASPSRGATRTRAASVPPSPSRATTQAKAASLPPSPSHATREAPAVSQTRSPSPAAPQPRAASVPPSQTRTTSQPKPTPQTLPQRQSSSNPTSQISNQISSPSSPPKRVTQLQPTVSQSSQFPPPPSRQEEPRPAEEKKNGPAKDLPAQTKKDKIAAASTGEQIKTVSSTHPKLGNKLPESHQKPGMANREQVPLQKEIKDDITKFVHRLATGQLKYPMDDKPVSIVTIAGENRGASMHMGSEPVRKEGPVHIHRGYKLNPDESTGTTTDAEESRKGKEAQNSTREEPVKKAFLNSNTQSINNSMVLESSVNEGSAGIHLVLSQNLAEPIKSEPLETHKAEFSVTPAQKLTYDPTIRRRCLRGLFLESSDSDPENPEKPRRHGCRYSCGQMSKDKDIGIF